MQFLRPQCPPGGLEWKDVRASKRSDNGYDARARVLDIEFDTRRLVRYENVGRETAERFLTSAHPASFWRDEIEENYTSHEITEEESRRTGAKEKHAGLDDLKRLFGDL